MNENFRSNHRSVADVLVPLSDYTHQSQKDLLTLSPKLEYGEENKSSVNSSNPPEYLSSQDEDIM